MAGRYRLTASWLPASRICSISSRNLRNMIQVSSGRRSRSPLSPLSLRMMSRRGFDQATELLGCRLRLFRRDFSCSAIISLSGGIEQRLQFG